MGWGLVHTQWLHAAQNANKPWSLQRIGRHKMCCRPEQLKFLSSVPQTVFLYYICPFLFLSKKRTSNSCVGSSKKTSHPPESLQISDHTLLIKCVIKSRTLHNRALDVPRRSGSSFTTNSAFTRSHRCSLVLCSHWVHGSWESTWCAKAEQRHKDVMEGVRYEKEKKKGQVPKSCGIIQRAIKRLHAAPLLLWSWLA